MATRPHSIGTGMVTSMGHHETKSRVWRLWRWGYRGMWTLVVGLAVAAAAGMLYVSHLESDLPSVADIKNGYRPPQVTRVLARDGTVLAELFTERRTVVPLETLPAHVKLAFLAAEDAHFYEHEGLNYLGMIRALFINLRSGKTRQGASTITQQLVKNTLLDPERTYRRKMREVILARRLEESLSKDEILELYLNQIYFAHGRYGVEEAARYYFGRGARDLTLAQAAQLAGVVASPEAFSPRKHPDRANERRKFVLDQMLGKGFIDPAQHAAAVGEPIALVSEREAQSELAPEAVEIAKRVLREVAGPGADRGGFVVTTTIDASLQAAARRAVAANLRSYDERHRLIGPLSNARGKGKAFDGTPQFGHHQILAGEVTGADDKAGLLLVRVGSVAGAVQLRDFERYNPKKLLPSEFARPGTLVRVSLLEAESPDKNSGPVPLRLELGPQSALVAIDVRSREVLALVGNYDAVPGALDRATQARRQPGSTFKPFVYSYALHTRRYTPASLLETSPDAVEEASIANAQPVDARLRLREAVARSVNVTAVLVGREVGLPNVVSWARAVGIESELKPDLSLPLGAYEVTPLELANAYATFAGGGTYDTARVVLKIEDSQGRALALPPSPPARRVMEAEDAYLITSVLTSVIDHGTGARAKSLARPLAGKTGTSNRSRDAWFVGYSTDIVCAVWTGYDDGQSLGARESGATAALGGWMEFMKAAHTGRPATDFPRPAGVVAVRIDPASGLLAHSEQQDAIEEVFLVGTEPTDQADLDAGLDAQNAESDGSGISRDPLPGLAEPDASTLPPLPAPDPRVPVF